MYTEQRDISTGSLTGIKLGDKFIPISPSNADYVQYLDWVEAGNTASPDPDYTLVNAKIQRIEQMNSICSQKILAKWPLEKQNSVLAGIYPLQAVMAADISSLIAYSNDTHTLNINSLTKIEDVLAYDINAGWPVI